MPEPGPALEDVEEPLFRQVHPSFLREGRLSQQAFTPGSNDERLLSVARSTLTTAQGAYQLHTGSGGRQSAGTWAVTVAEAQSQGLAALSDPTTSPPEPVADPAHAVIDFRAVASNNQVKAKGAVLSRLASARGCLHP